MTLIKQWDERRSLMIFETAEELVTASASHFAYIVKSAIAERGKSFVALSGGSTPQAIFQKLTKKQLLLPEEWERLHLFWSDERAVPPDHPDSNYRMAMDAGFKNMPIPPHQIYRMHAEKDIEQNALTYEQALPDFFDLIMLGMGEDGHTASLFPHTAALHLDQRIAANFVPSKQAWRMTMTFPCLHKTRHLIVYTMGDAKKEMLRTLFCSPCNPDQYPAQGVGTKACPAVWFVDREAASLLDA